MKLNRKALKDLPNRKEGETTYREIYIVPSGLKHESGYMQIAVVGKTTAGDLEIAAYPDDICWDMRKIEQSYDSTGMRTDCSYPEGVLHFWGRSVQFIVEGAFSSTTIRVEKFNKNNP